MRKSNGGEMKAGSESQNEMDGARYKNTEWRGVLGYFEDVCKQETGDRKMGLGEGNEIRVDPPPPQTFAAVCWQSECLRHGVYSRWSVCLQLIHAASGLPTALHLGCPGGIVGTSGFGPIEAAA
ncbi:hypothetical protein ACOMHN_011194 [Nucella lapillus]